jgi:hypothetical protein
MQHISDMEKSKKIKTEIFTQQRGLKKRTINKKLTD